MLEQRLMVMKNPLGSTKNFLVLETVANMPRGRTRADSVVKRPFCLPRRATMLPFDSIRPTCPAIGVVDSFKPLGKKPGLCPPPALAKGTQGASRRAVAHTLFSQEIS